jgi:hypothetical protein
MARIPGSRQRAGVLRRVVKEVNSAAGQLEDVQAALKKMFGPLTPTERRDLRAGTKLALRGIDRFLRLLAKPRKRAGSKRPPKRSV